MADHAYVVRHILELDKLCFEQCISNYEKKFSVKEESCLKNCTTKVLNALDFLHSVNQRGGIDRAPIRRGSGFLE